jgi:hypothetical protein
VGGLSLASGSNRVRGLGVKIRCYVGEGICVLGDNSEAGGLRGKCFVVVSFGW